MSRSRILLTVLAMSLLASACTVQFGTNIFMSCGIVHPSAISVGERIIVYHSGDGRDDYKWNVKGPGTLDVEDYNTATYTATEPGSVEITFVGFETENQIVFPGGSVILSGVLWTGSCAFEVVAASVDVPVTLECETSRFKVEVGPRPVTAFHNGYIEFDTKVTPMAGMDYDISSFELSVGGDDELLAGTLDPRVSQPGGTSQSFSWQVTIDRVTGQDLPLGEHQLEVTVTEESGLSVGTMSCTLPFTIEIIQYGG